MIKLIPFLGFYSIINILFLNYLNLNIQQKQYATHSLYLKNLNKKSIRYQNHN